MSLLSLRKTSLKSYADDVLAKSKKINKSKTTIKGGNSRYEKIKSICYTKKVLGCFDKQ